MSRLTFGVDRDPGVVLALAEDGAQRGRSHALKENPLLAVYGAGPEGARCGDCIHLFEQGGTARTYYKCELRSVSRSVTSDHRVRWPACGKFESAE